MRKIFEDHNRLQTRRQFLTTAGMGLGVTALGSLLPQNAWARSAEGPTPRAKQVIFLFMAGAPSQLDLFDYKPKLVELEGKPIPPSVIQGQRYAFIQPDAAVLGPRFRFARHGPSGAELSEAGASLPDAVVAILILALLCWFAFRPLSAAAW